VRAALAGALLLVTGAALAPDAAADEEAYRRLLAAHDDWSLNDTARAR
jgi:hypothetical protein